MKNSMRFLGLFLAALVLLPGCMRVPTYKCRSLKSVSNNFMYRGAEKNVIVRVKELSQAEKNYLFDARIRNNDFCVMYVSIHNLSDTHYIFSGDGVTIKQVVYQDVIKSMKKTSSASRFATGVACSASSAGAVYGAVAGLMLFQSTIMGGILFSLGIVTTGVTLVFFGASIKSIVMNNRLKKDLAEKIIHVPVIISSGEHYEGLIFVKSLDYTSQFAVTMHEKDNVSNTITFDVDLSQNEQQE